MPRRPNSGAWATLCAETLTGIADPLFPALTLARAAAPDAAARAVLAALLEPLESPARAEALPPWLLEHQADAVARARAILARFGGALIADGVGLGKTYIALALAALERAGGGDAVAVVPAALRGEWRRAAADTGTPLTVFSHTELATRCPQLAPRCTLLLVDEAHAFRNPATRRYDALARLAISRRVALLTATPVNNAVDDLAALVHLFAPRDRFREFGAPDIAAALRSGSPHGTLALGALAVCRTRRLVERRFPALAGAFPRRALLAPARYDLLRAFGPGASELLDALRPPAGDEPGERGAALMYLGLLKRMESSPRALRRSLLRHRHFLEECDRARAAGLVLSRRSFAAAVPRHDGDDAQLVMWPLLHAVGGAAGRSAAWRAGIDRALALLDAAPADDPKLAALERLLDGPLAGRKTIVFTEYRDTALHLLHALRRRRRVLAVAGDGAWAGTTRLSRRHALDAFAPRARGSRPDPLLDADILIATDVASEGMNLQDASAVVNYDLPWNPVRVMQRVGRVDRLNSEHAEVQVAHVIPGGGLAALCGVLETLRAKLAQGATWPGAEPDPLAALWWLGDGSPEPEAVERESWRRVAPFEAREHWRMLIGPCARPAGDAPVVAGAIADDGEPAGAALLLALEWPDGRRIPLPYVAGPDRWVRPDAQAAARLAERALAAHAIPARPAEFTHLLAAALPDARLRLAEYSAARHAGTAGPGRRAALERLRTHAATVHRRRGELDHIEHALAALAADVPAGLDRLLGRIAADMPSPDELARRVREVLAPVAYDPGDLPGGAPRIVLVAMLAVATRCAAVAERSA